MLNRLIATGKRFMAYDIVNRLKDLGKENLLRELADGVRTNEELKGKKHQVFRLSFDARQCFDQKMVEQKLNYIHKNPVKGKWNLVDDFVLYPHSSAGFYLLGQTDPKVSIVHYKDLGSY
jgi:hypothetical protein